MADASTAVVATCKRIKSSKPICRRNPASMLFFIWPEINGGYSTFKEWVLIRADGAKYVVSGSILFAENGASIRAAGAIRGVSTMCVLM